jgi:1-acyl-sn-glycerol-3-phosphate acyltransferase
MSRFELYVRASVFWFFHVVSLTIIVLGLMLTFPLPFRIRYATGSSWAKFSIFVLRHICKLDYRIEGLENIPNGAAIALCKHQSTWETFFLQKMLPPQHWVVKRELLFVPVFGWGLALLESIAIDRSAGRKAMEQLVERSKKKLDQGRWIVIFPEGTRVDPGVKSRYKLGGAVLASQVDYPVLPIAHNAGEFWPKHSYIKYPGLITVRIGKPMYCKGRKPEEVMREVETWIETQGAEISDPSRWNR